MEPEKWLESHGAQFKEQTVVLTTINKDVSLRNQARVSVPLNEETVLLYGVAMEQGSDFPRIIGYEQGNKFVVIDGNHRVAAAELAHKRSLPALVVTNPTPAMIQALTYEANTTHGLPTSLEERIQQAMHLMATGMSRTDAAKALSIPESRLAQAQELRQADIRIYKLRKGVVGGLPVAVRKRLDNIRSDTVLAAAVDLVTQAKMTAIDVSDMVTEVNRYREEDEQLRVIQQEVGRQAARVAATAGGKVNLPPALVALDRAMAAIDRVDPDKVAEAWATVGEGMKMILLAKVSDAQRKVKELLK